MRFVSKTSSGGVVEQLFTLGEIAGVLWTPAGAAGVRPLILMGHGGGQHKKAPGVAGRAHRFVTAGGFAVAAVDVPGHGDRPTDEEYDRIATQNQARGAAGEDLAPLIAGFQGLRGRPTPPGARPTDEEYDRIATQNQARVAAGEDLAPLIAGFQALVARQTVPEWRTVLDAIQELDYVGAGPVGYWGVSLGCGLGVPFVAAEPRVRAAVLGLGGALASAGAAARIAVPVEFLVQWKDERVPRTQCLALSDALASDKSTLHAHI